MVVEFRSGLGFQNPWSLKHQQRGDVYHSVFQPHFKPEFLGTEVFFKEDSITGRVWRRDSKLHASLFVNVVIRAFFPVPFQSAQASFSAEDE